MVALILVLGVGASSGAQSLRWLGALSNSGILPNGVSDDATVVVGDGLAPEMGFTADLLKALFAFGSAGTGYTRHEDINKDGIVDDADLLMVLFHFGNGC